MVGGIRFRRDRLPGRARVPRQSDGARGASCPAPGAGDGLRAAGLLLAERRRGLQLRAAEAAGQHRDHHGARRAGQWPSARSECAGPTPHLQLPNRAADGGFRARCVRREPAQGRVARCPGTEPALRARGDLHQSGLQRGSSRDPGGLDARAAEGHPGNHRAQREIGRHPARQARARLCERGGPRDSGARARPGEDRSCRRCKSSSSRTAT